VVCRYGAQSMVQYEMNLQRLCYQLKRLLAPETLVMWLTSMPVAQSVRGGFLIDEISFISEVLRVDVLSANYYASQVSCPICVLVTCQTNVIVHILMCVVLHAFCRYYKMLMPYNTTRHG